MSAKLAYDLRPLTTGDVLSRGLRLYMSHFPLLAGAYLLLCFLIVGAVTGMLIGTTNPYGYVDMWFDDPTAADEGRIRMLTWLRNLAGVAAVVLFAAPVATYVTARAYLGSGVSLWEGVKALFFRLPRMAMLGMVVLSFYVIEYTLLFGGLYVFAFDDDGGLITLWVFLMLGVLPLLLHFSASFGLAICAAMLEDRSPMEALRRGRALAGGARGAMFGMATIVALLLLGLMIPAWIVAGIVFDAGAPELSPLILEGWFALILPFANAVLVVFYFDLRVRKEAFDIDVLADSLGVDLPSGQAALQMFSKGYFPEKYDPALHPDPATLPQNAPMAAQGLFNGGRIPRAPGAFGPMPAPPQAFKPAPMPGYSAPASPPVSGS